MVASSSRRNFMTGALASAASMGIAPAFVRSAVAQTNQALLWPELSPGFTMLVTSYIAAKQLAKKHGIPLGDTKTYSSVPAYYGDVVSGTLQVALGSWDTWAARYLAGVPLRYVCTVTTGNMIGVLTTGKGPQSIEDLKGVTIAAPQSTGTYRLTRTVIKMATGIDIETYAKIQNVDNPASAVTLLMAGRADAGITWEPNISAGISKMPSIKVLYNIGEEYKKKTGDDLSYFGLTVRQEAIDRDPTLPQRLDALYADCIAGINANIKEAVEIAGARSGFPPEVLEEAIASKRLEFKHISMSDAAARTALVKSNKYLADNEALPGVVDGKFFAFS